MAARRNRGLAERRNSGLEGEGTGWKRDLACLIINRDCLPFHRVSMENMKQEFDKFGPERVRTILCIDPNHPVQYLKSKSSILVYLLMLALVD